MAEDDKLFVADAVAGDGANLRGIGTNEIGLLDAVDLPIIVISRDCKVTRINRAAAMVLGLKLSDVGCPIANSLAGLENLDKLCAQVIADGLACRREARDGDRWYLVRIAPYTGSDRQILGAVLTFTNVTAFRASLDQAIYEREHTKAILNTVIDPLVVLDAKLQVQTANRAFYAMFGVSRHETQGISIRELGNKEWAASEVWKSIKRTLSSDTQFQAVEIDREFPTVGRRTLMLDARRLERNGTTLLLLTFQDVTGRKQAEQTTSLLAAIVDSSDDAIVSKNLDGTITSWNRSAERLFGYTALEAIGQHITLIVPWERRSEEEDILRRLAQGERVDHFETMRKRKDGTTLDVSLTISPIRDAAGRVIGASKVARDVTERGQAQRALSEQARLLDLSNDAISIRDEADRVTYWNKAATQLYGFTREEALGRVTHELLQTQFPADLEKINQQLHRDEHWSGELVHTRKDGTKVIVISRWVLDRKAGNSWCILETNNDITRQKYTEKALRESEQRYRAMIDATPIMVWMSGLDKLCYYFNKSWLDFVGRTLEQELGDGWAKGVHPDDFDRCLQIYVSSFDARRPFEMQYRLRHHTGQYRWIFDHGVPRYAPDGTFEGYVGGCLDIHDQKEAEEKTRRAEVSFQLMRSQEEERRHIARELHDSAGQTLTVLGLSLAQLIENARASAPELANEAGQIEEIVQQLHREIRTTSYLLHPPLLDETGLNSAISWYVEGLLERSGLEVDLDISKQFGRLPRDMELMIFRLVQECLTNIHRHSESKTASIRLTRESNQITLDIRDAGKGMSAVRLAEVQSGRSGMGIRGMRERLRQFEGTMSIESNGSGTRVLASIPVPKAASSQGQDKAEPLQAAV